MSEVKEQMLDKFGKLADRMGERGLERLLDIGEGMAIMKEISTSTVQEQQQQEPQPAAMAI